MVAVHGRAAYSASGSIGILDGGPVVGRLIFEGHRRLLRGLTGPPPRGDAPHGEPRTPVTTPRTTCDLARRPTSRSATEGSLAHAQVRNECFAAACVVAVGFMLPWTVALYLLWAVVGVIVLWILVGDRIAAAVHHRTDPHRNRDVRYLFSADGFRVDDEDTQPSAWLTYPHVLAVYSDTDYWILRLQSGDLVMVARSGVDGGATSAAQFKSFLRKRANLVVQPVQKSLRAKVQRAQEGRQGFLQSNPGLLQQGPPPTVRVIASTEPEARGGWSMVLAGGPCIWASESGRRG